MLERASYFKDYMRCTIHQFNKLVKIVGSLSLKLKMNWRETISTGKQLGSTLNQVSLFNCVKYTRIVLKLIVFYRYLLGILFKPSIHCFALEGQLSFYNYSTSLQCLQKMSSCKQI